MKLLLSIMDRLIALFLLLAGTMTIAFKAATDPMTIVLVVALFYSGIRMFWLTRK